MNRSLASLLVAAAFAAPLAGCMPPKTANDRLAEGPLGAADAVKHLSVRVTGDASAKGLAEAPLAEGGMTVVDGDDADLRLEVVAKGEPKVVRFGNGMSNESFVAKAVVRVSDGKVLLGQFDADIESPRAMTSSNGHSEFAHETDEATMGRAMRAAVKKAITSAQVVAYAQKKAPPADTAVATVAAPNGALPVAKAGPAAAAALPNLVSAAPQPNAWAVVVGVETYKDMPRPTGARADAERFAAVAERSLGVPAAHVHTLVDGDATKGALERELEWVKTNAKPGSRVYFFFSGHGSPDTSNGAPYLLPADADAKFVTATALSLKDVLGRLSSSKAKEVLVFVDSCYSGSGGRSVLPPGARPLVRVQEQKAAAQIALFSASSGAEISGPAPDGSGGLFSSTLVSGLGTGAADLDGDGSVSLQELNDYVKPRVLREAQKDRRDQTPSLVVGNGLGEPSSVLVSWGLPAK